MVKSGYKKYWERKKNIQDLNFTIALNRIKNGLSVTLEDLERIYKKRNLSKKQKEILLKKLEQKKVCVE